VKLIEGLDLQSLEQSATRRGNMDRGFVHVSLKDARFVGKIVMDYGG